MKLNIPSINKVKNIVPMFNGDNVVDIVGVVDDVCMSLGDVTGDSENEILSIGWIGKSGMVHKIFTEGNISKAILTGGNLVMRDSKGEELTLRFS